MNLSNPYVHTLLPLFLIYIAPVLMRLALHPSPTSRWGLFLARLVKLGFDPAAFESQEKAILDGVVETMKKNQVKP